MRWVDIDVSFLKNTQPKCEWSVKERECLWGQCLNNESMSPPHRGTSTSTSNGLRSRSVVLETKVCIWYHTLGSNTFWSWFKCTAEGCAHKIITQTWGYGHGDIDGAVSFNVCGGHTCQWQHILHMNRGMHLRGNGNSHIWQKPRHITRGPYACIVFLPSIHTSIQVQYAFSNKFSFGITSLLSQFTHRTCVTDASGCGSNPWPLGKGFVDTFICIGSQWTGATVLTQRCKSRSAFWRSRPAPKLANLLKAISEAPECWAARAL